MTYEKDKVTIHLEGDEVEDFWDIIMCALDYNMIAKANPKRYVPLTDDKLKLANKLEEIVRPSHG